MTRINAGACSKTAGRRCVLDCCLAASLHDAGIWGTVPHLAAGHAGCPGPAAAHRGFLAPHCLQRAAHPGGLSAGGGVRRAAGRSQRPLEAGGGSVQPPHAADPRHAGGQLCHPGIALGQQRQPFGHCQLHPRAAGGLRRCGGGHRRHRPASWWRWPGFTGFPLSGGCGISGCREFSPPSARAAPLPWACAGRAVSPPR